MTTRNEPAFPLVRVEGEQYSGMTLRDYFAAATRTKKKGVRVVLQRFDFWVQVRTLKDDFITELCYDELSRVTGFKMSPDTRKRVRITVEEC